MESRRTTVGTVVSIAWIAGAAFLLLRNPSAIAAMKPNEWGDFFAGASAPLAFLWLVLGYFQQGEELKFSTEALRLQAEELRNSVQQQRALVEVSRQQVESEREALAFERRLREDMSQPIFTICSSGGSFRGDGESTYNVKISNSGHDATAFSAYFVLEDASRHGTLELALFPKGAEHSVHLTTRAPLSGTTSHLYLAFTDGLGRPQLLQYVVERANDSPHAGLKVHKVDA